MTTTPVTSSPVCNSRTHELKTDPAVFEAVWTGVKTFEIRKNDRDFKVGDSLCLLETVHSGNDMKHAGMPLLYTDRTLVKVVSHVLTGYGLMEGWCCLSFAPALAQQWPGTAVATSWCREFPALAADLINHLQHKLARPTSAQPSIEPDTPTFRDMPNPTAEDLASPMFEAIWQVIKSWDVNVPACYQGYCGANGSHVKMILEALAAGGEASSITIDFRQATELLEMFGDEPTEITLMTGDGHSGNGLYAVYNADPEGSVYLGQTDEEATPDAAAPTQAPMQPSYEQIDELLQDHAKGSREMHDFARSVLALAGGEATALLREMVSWYSQFGSLHHSDVIGKAREFLAAAPADAVEPRTTPLCRDCADFGPICPSSGQPCDKRAAAAPEGLTDPTLPGCGHDWRPLPPGSGDAKGAS